MQIDSALPSTVQADRATKTAVSSSSSVPSSAQSAQSAQSANEVASTASEQDDAVHISSEGASAAAQDGSAATDASTSDPSPVKSFTYGTLGLERPDQPHEDRNAFYTAGRWLAAGITLGGIISLLI